ncbi:MAG: hypothetical protein HYX78_10320 [Armatimonadetes bacterium]|nr:hypothetical protein [Armatimonadota bacterium]
MRLALIIIFVLLLTSYCSAWDGVYEGDVLPGPPLDTSDVTNPATVDDLIEVEPGNWALRILDGAYSRARYRLDYGTGQEAGTLETRQRFVSANSFDNISLTMRQDAPGNAGEVRVCYFNDGSGHRGLWDVWAEPDKKFLGPLDPDRFYKLRMVIDGITGGRLYVNDSCFAELSPGPGNTSRITFGANSTEGTGEVYIDYFRWKQSVKAGPGEPGDPSTEPIVSPRISTFPVAVTGLDSAIVSWTTDVPADSVVRWGATWGCPHLAYEESLVTEHSVTIFGLQQGTRYFFRVESRDPNDQDVARSGISDFTTENQFRIDSGPFVRLWTQPAGAASVCISWTTTLPADSNLFYRPRNSSEPWTEVTNTNFSTSHAVSIEGLSPMSDYEYYVSSTKSDQESVQSPVLHFFTYDYSQAGSLLSTNAGFELGNIGPYTPGWIIPAGSDPGSVHSGLWRNSIAPHSGNFFLGADSEGGARNGVVYQSITGLPGGDYVYASVWAHTYEIDTSGAESHDSAFCQVGLDVVQEVGSINPDAPTVAWSAPVFTRNTGPWTCIGVILPRDGSDHATIFLRNVQVADRGLNITSFDDAVLTVSPPVSITSGPAVTSITPTSATIEWTTDADSTAFVQFGPGTLSNYSFTEHYSDTSLQKTHSATIRLRPNSNYVFQVGSASSAGIVLSQPATLTTPMNDVVENPGFEDTDSHGFPTTSPWTQFQYDISQIPRFYDPAGQPAGGPINGLIGLRPAGGIPWYGITCEQDSGSHFLGAFSYLQNKNGGVYQRVKVTPGEKYRASMRFLTHQNPIDVPHPAAHTACAIAIDPYGGTNLLSSNLIWSPDQTSSIDGQWDTASVEADAVTSTITIFCLIEQRYADAVHLNAIDNVTLEIVPPFSGTIGDIKQQSVGDTVQIDSTVVTYVRPYDRLYIEEDDRSAGIAVIPATWDDPPAPGDRISGTGRLDIVAGEAVVADVVITKTPGSPLDVPAPLVVTQTYLGGTAFGIQPGVDNGLGLSTTGLLVKVVGRVTSDTWTGDGLGRVYAHIDDGSRIGNFGLRGVKIIADENQPNRPEISYGQWVSAVGVSSVENFGIDLRLPVVLIGDVSTVHIVGSGF